MTWNRIKADPYNPLWPLPADTQTWEMGVAAVEPITPSVPLKATEGLNAMQAEQERFARMMREPRPERTKPGSRR
jgi:hypothetical protein